MSEVALAGFACLVAGIFLPVKTLSFFFLLPLAVSAADSWPGWRGESRNAEIAGFEVPEAWPDSLKKVWEVEVGEGYATPLVVDGKIYQHARVGGEEVLWQLDAGTGKVEWKAGIPIAFEPGRGGERHGRGPKSTPAFDEGRIFTMSINGTLAAWDAEDGEVLWQKDFRGRFEELHPYWGTATSPLADDGKVYVHAGGCEGGGLLRIEGASGKELWVQEEHANCYSSPLMLEVEGVRQLVEFNHHGLCGVDLATGEYLWESMYPHRGNNQNVPTPVFVDGLFVMGGEDRGVFAVRAERKGGEWTAERVWRHRDVSLEMSSPVVSEGVVYGFSHFKMGQYFALDPKSGEVLWSGEARAGDNAQLLAVPGHVLALNDRGELQVMRSSREKCDIVKTYEVGQSTWAAPALVGDALLIKDGDRLVRWEFPREAL